MFVIDERAWQKHSEASLITCDWVLTQLNRGEHSLQRQDNHTRRVLAQDNITGICTVQGYLTLFSIRTSCLKMCNIQFFTNTILNYSWSISWNFQGNIYDTQERLIIAPQRPWQLDKGNRLGKGIVGPQIDFSFLWQRDRYLGQRSKCVGCILAKPSPPLIKKVLGQFEFCKYQSVNINPSLERKSSGKTISPINPYFQDFWQRVCILAFLSRYDDGFLLGDIWKSHQFHDFTIFGQIGRSVCQVQLSWQEKPFIELLPKPNQGQSSGTGQKCHHGALS